MGFSTLDTVAFVGYFLIVGMVAVLAGRREKEAADYFLAGRSDFNNQHSTLGYQVSNDRNP